MTFHLCYTSAIYHAYHRKLIRSTLSISKHTMSDYYTIFKHHKSEVEGKIENAKTAEDLNILRSEVSDILNQCRLNRSSFSNHDLQIYQKDIQTLTEKIDSKIAGLKTRKLAFGRRRKPETDSKETTAEIKPPSLATSAQTVSTITGTELTSLNLSSPHFIDISTSKVLLENQFSSVKISNCHDSLFYLPHISGPVYIDNCQNSVLIISCHQFRLHKSSNCTIYLSCASKRPIIEDSEELLFSQFPPSLSRSSPIIAWEAVDDFNWLKRTPNIHWKSLQLPSEDNFNLTKPTNVLLECLNKC